MHGIAYIYKRFGGYRHFAQKNLVDTNISRRKNLLDTDISYRKNLVEGGIAGIYV